MNQVSLSDVYWFQEGPGVRNWQFKESGIKLLNVANITKQGKIDLDKTDRHLSTEEVDSKYQHFLIDEGDLVIASSGITNDEDNLLRTKIAFIEKQHLPLCLNTSTIRFKAKDGVSDLKFLKHWLNSLEFRQQITKEVTGIAKKNFGPSHLKKIKISLPPLTEQRRIASILDQADELRQKRQQAIEKLDQLLQATFIDMFGDPVSNPKGWDLRSVGEISESKLGKMLDKKKQSSEIDQYKYLRNANVQWFRFDLSDVFEMEFNEKDRKNCELKFGDVLVCEGGEPGRAAIWKNDLENCFFQKALHRVRLDMTQILPEYFVWLFWFYSKNGGFDDHITVATIAHLTGVKMKAMQIPIPPLSLQEDFQQKVNEIEVLKTTLENSSKLFESLFSSLQNQVFNGTL